VILNMPEYPAQLVRLYDRDTGCQLYFPVKVFSSRTAYGTLIA